MAHWELSERESHLDKIVVFTLIGKYKKMIIDRGLIQDFEKHFNFLLKKFGYSR